MIGLEDPKSDDQPKAAPPRYEAYRWLDSDRDGFISRQEYFSGRSSVTFAGQARRRAALRRLDSRFRDADRNRDGRVSAGELEGLGNARF